MPKTSKSSRKGASPVPTRGPAMSPSESPTTTPETDTGNTSKTTTTTAYESQEVAERGHIFLDSSKNQQSRKQLPANLKLLQDRHRANNSINRQSLRSETSTYAAKMFDHPLCNNNNNNSNDSDHRNIISASKSNGGQPQHSGNSNNNNNNNNNHENIISSSNNNNNSQTDDIASRGARFIPPLNIQEHITPDDSAHIQSPRPTYTPSDIGLKPHVATPHSAIPSPGGGAFQYSPRNP